jgi:hypothetical protein
MGEDRRFLVTGFRGNSGAQFRRLKPPATFNAVQGLQGQRVSHSQVILIGGRADGPSCPVRIHFGYI